jgi:ornithine cyclodeaminase/alanine dehydrogenase-like protein (mu-crystallin family)
MLILGNDELIGLVPPLQIIEAVEAALRAQLAGRVNAPKRLHTEGEGSTYLTMPSFGDEFVGVKLVSVIPANATRGLPVTGGIMILIERQTGSPLAFMDAATLTAQRTGAVGALGVKYLSPQNTSSLGIVGCGVQGTWQAIYACAVRPIREVVAFCRSASSFERFATTVHSHVPHVHLTHCATIHELLERAETVIAATPSNVPVLPDEPKLLEGRHFISIGSFKPTMQELPDSVYRLAGFLAVDSEHAVEEVGDVINPLKLGILNERDVFSIGDCVAGRRVIDTASTTAYKSVGSAIYDLFVADALYRAAKLQGMGTEVSI